MPKSRPAAVRLRLVEVGRHHKLEQLAACPPRRSSQLLAPDRIETAPERIRVTADERIARSVREPVGKVVNPAFQRQLRANEQVRLLGAA
jgi:hypothetical protein